MPAALGNLARLARTLRPLSLSQLAWRGRRVVARRLPVRGDRWRPAIDGRALAGAVRADDFPEVPIVHRLAPSGDDAVRQLIAGEFCQLNRSEHLGRVRPDWQLGPRAEHRLWTVTLHYHAWAYELAEAVRRGGGASADAESTFVAYLSDWIERCDLNVAGARPLAWNAYAVATRIGWWIRSYLALGSGWWQARPAVQGRFLESLWQQSEYLAAHVEWDLRGNHLLRDASGLAWAGRFFRGERPRRWQELAARLARDQVREQVLEDGGHFERSPMYQLHVMDDVLALAVLVEDRDAREELRAVWAQMAEYAAWMRHPD
ncbi:MAG TPA: heparinase II/III family protein, partial [Planctomycetaceae bacterium]|nr:heparinase II/III family protein [Planctomycetaceae bacterium]